MAHQALHPLLQVILALVTTALPLRATFEGGAELLSWNRGHRGKQYYVEYWYLGEAGWWRLICMMGVLPTGLVLFQ
jgi:hypothetical protein